MQKRPPRNNKPRISRTPSKKRKPTLLYFIIGAIILGSIVLADFYYKGYISTFFYGLKKESPPPTKKNPTFGVQIPNGYSIYGIDISFYQGRIDWSAVNKMKVKDDSITFAFIKATEGVTRTDAHFYDNWKAIKKTTLLRGAYHFFIPWRTGKSQAEHFLSVVNFQKGDLAPVLDFEKVGNKSKTKIIKEIKSFCEEIEKNHHIKPIIYTNLKLYRDYIQGNFDDYPLWIAYYNPDNTEINKHDWLFWQFTEKGKVNGISGTVDFNVFQGRYGKFEDLFIE